MEVQCDKCKLPIPLAKCLTCTKCENHYHSECTKMDNSTPYHSWRCDGCTSSRSGTHATLDLERLQDEINTERISMNKRFDILQKHFNTLKTSIDVQRNHSDMSAKQLFAPEVNKPDVDGICRSENDRMGLESGLQKMFARQVISSDLPVFNGKPEDWPIFISCYNNSTKACGFTNVENLMRLQRCLQGPARRAVGSKLLLPECVSQVIDTLRLLYGRPELLISTLIKQIHDTPAPKNDDLDSLIAYGLEVRNLSDHMVAAGLESHLNNPCLLHEMVNKLPTHLKLQWAYDKRKFNDVTIATFSSFMSKLVEAASQVTSNVTFDLDTQRDEHSASYDSDEERRSYRPSSNSSRRERRKRCYVCKGNYHRILTCSVFTSMSVSERWEIVNEGKLCPCCLNRHLPWPCRTVRSCGIDNCQLKHHPMLHLTINEIPSTSGCTIDVSSKDRYLLKYIPVSLYGKVKKIDTFAFIDEGSSHTIMEQKLAKELGVEEDCSTVNLKWIDGTVRKTMSKITTVGISETGKTNQFSLNNVSTVNRLDLPLQTFDSTTIRHSNKLPIPNYLNAKPRLLIGLADAHLVAPSVVHADEVNKLIAFKCQLGWCAYGYDSNQVSKGV
ncbi:uncharacterized protein LOC134215063 [Armigeres subalbatus]|uniref:uncharacterized protein LOC134215063 n=1 Tax=Armigeres subalbatus TaxID=124917 RepID=UPI002ED3C6F7